MLQILTRILADKKHDAVCHAYLLAFLQIPMFKNYLMFLVQERNGPAQQPRAIPSYN